MVTWVNALPSPQQLPAGSRNSSGDVTANTTVMICHRSWTSGKIIRNETWHKLTAQSSGIPSTRPTQGLHFMLNVVLFRIHIANLGNALPKKLSSTYTYNRYTVHVHIQNRYVENVYVYILYIYICTYYVYIYIYMYILCIYICIIYICIQLKSYANEVIHTVHLVSSRSQTKPSPVDLKAIGGPWGMVPPLSCRWTPHGQTMGTKIPWDHHRSSPISDPPIFQKGIESPSRSGGFRESSWRGTPSHHPFLDGILPNKNHLFCGTPILGKPLVEKTVKSALEISVTSAKITKEPPAGVQLATRRGWKVQPPDALQPPPGGYGEISWKYHEIYLTFSIQQ